MNFLTNGIGIVSVFRKFETDEISKGGVTSLAKMHSTVMNQRGRSGMVGNADRGRLG